MVDDLFQRVALHEKFSDPRIFKIGKLLADAIVCSQCPITALQKSSHAFLFSDKNFQRSPVASKETTFLCSQLEVVLIGMAHKIS